MTDVATELLRKMVNTDEYATWEASRYEPRRYWITLDFHSLEVTEAEYVLINELWDGPKESA